MRRGTGLLVLKKRERDGSFGLEEEREEDTVKNSKIEKTIKEHRLKSEIEYRKKWNK